MTGKILIYGGSGGIGSATAKALRARGYDLHLVGRSEDKLSAAAAEIRAGFTVGDVTDRDLFARAASVALFSSVAALQGFSPHAQNTGLTASAIAATTSPSLSPKNTPVTVTMGGGLCPQRVRHVGPSRSNRQNRH